MRRPLRRLRSRWLLERKKESGREIPRRESTSFREREGRAHACVGDCEGPCEALVWVAHMSSTPMSGAAARTPRRAAGIGATKAVEGSEASDSMERKREGGERERRGRGRGPERERERKKREKRKGVGWGRGERGEYGFRIFDY